jgi:soluble lytic murein transglycosylase-like protein
MSLLLTICLSVPGVCQTGYVDQIEGLAVSETESADPVQRWRPLVAAYFPDAEVETALCIIRHESGGNPNADNPGSTARGLFQILGSLWASHYGVAQAELYDPVTNIRIAGDIWDQHGWSAWSPYQRGVCRSG